MQNHISVPNLSKAAFFQDIIDQKTKPPGSLGLLEIIALKIALIQDNSNLSLEKPAMFIMAADHGLAKEGVSAFPQEVTGQMVLNFINGGAAINVFCKQHSIDLKVIDCGIVRELPDHPDLIKMRIAQGTNNMIEGPAMSSDQVKECLNNGSEVIKAIAREGSNVVGFGEMGIGNTSAASLIMSEVCNLNIEDCTGPGTGLHKEALSKKIDTLKRIKSQHKPKNPWEIMQFFGGFEIVTMCGAMLEAAKQRMIVMVDGFIGSSAYLLAHQISPAIRHYAIFCHCSHEPGHKKMLDYLGEDALLNLNLRLGEGTGCALAYPLIVSAVRFFNEMASFSDAGVTNRD